MHFTVTDERDEAIAFECADNMLSQWTCADILRGKTYPYLGFVDDVRVVFDVGANCGAASVHFARYYPDAVVHAFEPGTQARGYLEHNVAAYPNVVIHPFGLHAVDQETPLYMGAGDIGLASVIARDVNTEQHEMVELRAAGPWARAKGIDRIDVLKVDVEGCEVDVLESLRSFVPDVKVLYVEYDSRDAARFVEQLFDPDHDLFTAAMFLDQGECVWVRKDYSDRDGSRERLRELVARKESST